MTKARSTVVLAALVLGALGAVLAVFQRDSRLRGVAPSSAVATPESSTSAEVEAASSDVRHAKANSAAGESA
jgi:hypothetical protein